MNANNLHSILSYSEPSRLKDGTNVKVTGEVFQEPIWKTGDPLVYSQVKIENGSILVGMAYYPQQLNESDLKETVAEVALNPDQYRL